MADADKPGNDPEAASAATNKESGGAADDAPAKPRSRPRAKAASAAEAAGQAVGSAAEAADKAAEAAEAAEAVADEPAQEPDEPAAKGPARASAKPRTRSKAAADAAESAPDRPSGGRRAAKPAPDVPAERAGLKLHHLRPAPGAHRAKTRVGRGEASKGKTAGRGTKGTKARDNMAPRFEGGQMPLHRRVPKLKGFSNARFKTVYQVVNTGRLAELYPDGGDVTPDDLVARGAVRKGELIKVLGAGDVGSALRVTAHAFSASAKEKITAAGGTITEL